MMRGPSVKECTSTSQLHACSSFHSVDAVLDNLILYSVLVYANKYVAQQRNVLMKSRAHPAVLNSLSSQPWHLPPYTQSQFSCF
jgi:hypothetical protein